MANRKKIQGPYYELVVLLRGHMALQNMSQRELAEAGLGGEHDFRQNVQT